jgi:hypothetical protein
MSLAGSWPQEKAGCRHAVENVYPSTHVRRLAGEVWIMSTLVLCLTPIPTLDLEPRIGRIRGGQIRLKRGDSWTRIPAQKGRKMDSKIKGVLAPTP